MIGPGITRLGGVGIAVAVTMLLVNEHLVRRASSDTQQEPALREVTIEASGCAQRRGLQHPADSVDGADEA